MRRMADIAERSVVFWYNAHCVFACEDHYSEKEEDCEVSTQNYEYEALPTTADSDLKRGFDDALNRYMIVGVRQNAEEAWIRAVDEYWIKMLRVPPHYPKPVDFDKYDQVTMFLDAALILRNYHSHVLIFEKKMLYFSNTSCKAASVA